MHKPLLPALTGLRWFAAMWVILLHFGQALFTSAPPLVQNVRNCGYVAVGLFFILSGFVLAYSYLGNDGRLRVTKEVFWKARFARIYPVYLLAILIALPLFARKFGLNGSTLATLAANIALVQAWSPDTALELNSPGWSLSAEAFFYAIFPFAALLIARIQSRRLPWVMVTLWVLALLPAAIHTYSGAPDSKWGSVSQFNPAARCPEFLLGICLGLLYGRKIVLPRKWMAAAGAAGIVILSAASDRIPYLLMHNGLVDPFFILLILGLTHPDAGLAQLLSAPRIVLIGEASYGLYILHYQLWVWTIQVNKKLLHADSTTAAFFMLYACGATLVSVISYRRVETPCRHHLTARFQGERAESARQPAAATARC